MENKNLNITEEILIKYLQKSADLYEISDVENWLKVNAENRAHFEQLKKFWELSEKIREIDSFDEETALKKVKIKMNIPESKSVVKKLIPYFAIAASVLLIITIYFIFKDKTSPNSIDEKQIIVETFLNEKKEIILPDSSVIFLNQNSKITYPEQFTENERLVLFEGEAYFIITKDKSKPFKIKTINSEVEVVGTEFNLRAIKNEADESIIVSEGKVVFSQLTSVENKVELTIGEKATINKSNNKIIEEINKDENFLAWKTGLLTFTDKPLSYVVETLSKFYNVNIEITDSNIENLTLNATYDNVKLDDLIEILQISLEIKIEKGSNKYLFSK